MGIRVAALCVVLSMLASSGALRRGKQGVDKASCSSADYAVMDSYGFSNSGSSFPGRMATCGRNSLTFLLQWSRSKFLDCAQGQGLSSGCASCYEGSGKYGFDNCKLACLASWCSGGCLNCVAGYNSTLAPCVGRVNTGPPSC